LLSILDVQFDVASFLLTQRLRVIRKFQRESRIAPPRDGDAGWDFMALHKLFAGAGLSDEAAVVDGVIKALDVAPSDGRLSHTEVAHLVSPADGKLSFGALELAAESFSSGGGDSLFSGLSVSVILKTAWDGFLVSVIGYFFYAIINQMAESKAAELRAKTMKKGK
jgi:hypothetical protein